VREAENILLILGAGFIAVGALVGGIFVGVGEFGVMAFMPFFFCLLGATFCIAVFVLRYKRSRIIKKGIKYSAKIYGYTTNTSIVVNGQFTSDLKVHYFDNNGIEREVILIAGFAKGGFAYPIGMTIDIYEYKGKFNFDPKSVRDEILPREAELMDDKPVDPGKLNVVAVKCPNCGASFEAASGYSNRCPYCSGFINA